MADIFPGAQVIPSNGFYSRPRPNPALIWSVIHTTANTASAEAEAMARRDAANANDWRQVTATFFVNQDGSAVQLLTDPVFQAPWTNGVWEAPDLSNPRLKACWDAGVNPNRRTLVSIENVSNVNVGVPITAAQEATNGRIIAWAHALAGVIITRETVIGHYQIASINRRNCPAPDKSVIDRIIAIATGELDMRLAGVKATQVGIGSFRFDGVAHSLISPIDLEVQYPQPPNAGPYNVIAAVDLKDPNGVAMDINGNKPPRNSRDQVYLVDAPNFGVAAYALRQDGAFTPTLPPMYTQAELDAAVAAGIAAALPPAQASTASAVAEAAVAEAEKYQP